MTAHNSRNDLRRILELQVACKDKSELLQCIKLLEQRSDIYSAEPNYYIEGLSAFVDTPNDTLYVNGKQWTIDKLQLHDAWNISKGSAEVKVGIIDSGIDNGHPDLASKVDDSGNYYLLIEDDIVIDKNKYLNSFYAME